MASKVASEIYLTKGHFNDEKLSLSIFLDGSIEVCVYDKYNKTIKANPILEPHGNGFDLQYGVNSMRITIPFSSPITGKLEEKWCRIK